MHKLLLAGLLLPSLAFVAPADWRSAGPFGGSATAIAVNPANPSSLLLGARNSLLFRSDDEGRTWRRLSFPRHFLGTVRALAIDPQQPTRYYAALTSDDSPFGGVWRSLDAGQTWTLLKDTAGTSAESLAMWRADPRRLVAGTRQGVWLTTNGGDTWIRISHPWNHEMRVITAVAIDPVHPDTIYAGTPHLPWKTTDGGKTWDSIHAGMLEDSDVFSIFIDPNRPERLFASACSGIYRSETAGARWTKFQGIPGILRRTHSILARPDNPRVIYAGTTLGLLRSSDGGATFKKLNSLSILSMALDPVRSGRLYMAAESAGLWRSDDGGTTAEPWNAGFVNRKVLDLAASGGRLYANTIQDGEAGGVFSSQDEGATWTLTANAGRIGDNHIHLLAGHPEEASTLFAANDRRLYRTLDGGRTWKPLSLPPTPRGSSLRISALTSYEQGSSVVLLLGTDRGLWRSANLGVAWSPVVVTKADRSARVLGITVALPRLIVRTANALYVSTDSGNSWQPIGLLLPTVLIYDIALSADPAAPLLLATAKGLLGSDDGGRTWTPRQSGLEEGTVAAVRYHPARPGRVWAVQFGRLYESKDSGRTWHRVQGGEISESSIRLLWADPRLPSRLFAVTPDLGVFYLDL